MKRTSFALASIVVLAAFAAWQLGSSRAAAQAAATQPAAKATTPATMPATTQAATQPEKRGIDGLEVSLILPGEKQQDAVILSPKKIKAKLQITNNSGKELKVALVNKVPDQGDLTGQWVIGLFLEARNMDNTGAGLFRKADPQDFWLKIRDNAPALTLKAGESATADITLDNCTDSKGNMLLDLPKGQYLLQPSLLVYEETQGYWFGQASGKQVLIRTGETTATTATAPASQPATKPAK